MRIFEGVTKDVVAAAATLGVQIDIVRASDSREIEAAFATLVRNKVNRTADRFRRFLH